MFRHLIVIDQPATGARLAHGELEEQILGPDCLM